MSTQTFICPNCFHVESKYTRDFEGIPCYECKLGKLVHLGAYIRSLQNLKDAIFYFLPHIKTRFEKLESSETLSTELQLIEQPLDTEPQRLSDGESQLTEDQLKSRVSRLK